MKSPFLNAVAENMRLKRYAEKTIKAYIFWIKSFIHFNNKQHRHTCHDTEIESFLSYLANTKRVAPISSVLVTDVTHLEPASVSRL